ncbi:Cu(I)-responsive transcriptional regulator [Alsobacter sp. KACC 23698]|uniref:Cu(I)-responsive transcriptional regulator n=1 Tax=Alsobacter sp. KACC 23698 TaxID=3149229 RepID=A0AAU7JDR9_9HYPH
MNIGEAAAAAGLSAKMIRYYESIGLVPPPARSEAGYRVYTQAQVDDLSFVRRARDLGFSVDSIARLLALWRDGGRTSAEVKEVALGHVSALRRRIREMEAMASALEGLAAQCHGDGRPTCPILDDLGSERSDELSPRNGRHPGKGRRFGLDAPATRPRGGP